MYCTYQTSEEPTYFGFGYGVLINRRETFVHQVELLRHGLKKRKINLKATSRKIYFTFRFFGLFLM